MYHHIGKGIIRVPLNSINEMENFRTVENLGELFLEGLYLASRDLYNEVEKIGSLKDNEKDKLLASVYKYWIRSCMRCTPYGTFAACGTLKITDEETVFLLNEKKSFNKSLRFDMNFIYALIDVFRRRFSIDQSCMFHLNNSLYETDIDVRFVDYRINNSNRLYNLTLVERSDYLKLIISRCKYGASKLDLYETLKAFDRDLDDEDIQLFIGDVIDSQIIVSDFEPTLTGIDPLEQVINYLGSNIEDKSIVNKLIEVKNLLERQTHGVFHLKNIEQKILEIAQDLKLPKNVFQADLYLSSEKAQLNEQVVNDLVENINLLNPFVKNNANADLKEFKRKFLARFDHESVPLAFAIDSDLGVGYSNIQDVNSGSSHYVDEIVNKMDGHGEMIEADNIQRFIQQKYDRYLRTGELEIEVTDKDLKLISDQKSKNYYCDSMFIMGAFFGNSTDSKDKYLFELKGISGVSGANLLTRFSNNEDIKQIATKVIEEEQSRSSDVIFAEIVHLPEERTGNILVRPNFREYEIPYMGKSGNDTDKQILIEDIYIKIENDNIKIFSKKLEKEIIPRLTAAHNFNYRSLPIYKFLCDLQYQNSGQFMVWPWGLLGGLDSLPRVRYKNVILQKACWRLKDEDIKGLPTDENQFVNYFMQIRKSKGIHEEVLIQEGDNQLLIKFSSIQALKLLIIYIKRYKSIRLVEVLFNKDNCVVFDDNGAPYVNEIILPLIKDGIVSRDTFSNKIQTNASLQRIFSPTSEWQYFKIYCGSKTADKLLREHINNFIVSGKEDGLFEEFFFVRYWDSQSHIRIRFRNRDLQKRDRLLKNFSNLIEPLMQNGVISSIQIDTYKRELERYSFELIEQSEDIFFADSLAVLTFLSSFDNPEIDTRILFAILGIDSYLDDFGIDLEHKHLFIKQLHNSFSEEFDGSDSLKRILNNKYRTVSNRIVSVLVGNEFSESTFIMKDIIQKRSIMSNNVTSFILETLSSAGHKNRLYSLLSSYLHMFVNRLFISHQRKYELVCYHFLERFYYSQMAIKKRK